LRRLFRASSAEDARNNLRKAAMLLKDAG